MDQLAGAETVIEAHPAQELWVLSTCQNILVAHVIGTLVDHPDAALHVYGVTAAQVGVEV